MKCRFFILSLLLLALSACATAPKSLTGIVPGREVETLQSSIAITLKAGNGGGGAGRGFLIFRYPDRFHLAMLSPFGLTVMEVFSDGARITCLIPSRQAAYSGLITELPESGGLKTFGLLQWVVARTKAPAAGVREIVAPSGDHLYFEQNGLVRRKVSAQGDEVSYAGYNNVNGVAFPESLEIKTSNGDRVRIVFDEPEINSPVESPALTPNLEGYSVLPLSEFKGM